MKKVENHLEVCKKITLFFKKNSLFSATKKHDSCMHVKFWVEKDDFLQIYANITEGCAKCLFKLLFIQGACKFTWGLTEKSPLSNGIKFLTYTQEHVDRVTSGHVAHRGVGVVVSHGCGLGGEGVWHTGSQGYE